MPRAYPTPQPQDYGQDPEGGDWQALRGELVALLDQVEGQVARSRHVEPQYPGIAERMRGLREQISEPDTRHREALRSVKRAVDRFNERDEGYPRDSYSRDDGYTQGYAANPRDTLQSAIQQIKARQREMAQTSVRAMEAQRYVEPQRGPDLPRFDELAQAVGGISGRLERLEGELRSAAKIQTGNVKEIAEQVAQLSHVVELLAGAVGETGQVKRLEAQIAGLAKLVAQGPQVDLSMLTRRLDELGGTVGKLFDRQQKDGAGVGQRLDDVSTTMGRLADLQVQFANRVDGATQATASLRDGLRGVEDGVRGTAQQTQSVMDGMKAIADGIRSATQESVGVRDGLAAMSAGMKAVEDGVRNIYDRIDAIEKHTAMSPGDVDRLTDEMARFTEAMRNPLPPQGLIELVDELNSRIGRIETSNQDVGSLKADVEALRNAVIEAVEPRFAALEMQLGTLSDRVSEQRVPAGDINVGQLEAQVRQLVARMDQTGEQLTGLARMYQPADPAPDFEALADLVAARTSEAVAQNAAPLPVPAGLSDAGIDEIEKRLSRLMQAAAGDRPAEDFSGIEISIREVNERLGRLEASLTERALEAERLAATPIEPVAPSTASVAVAPAAPVSHQAPLEKAPAAPGAIPYVSFNDPIAPLLAEAAETAASEARGEPFVRSDAMPADPSLEAPLTDKPFADQASPLMAALEAKNGPRKRHPGLTYDAPDEDAAPAAFEPPPAPRSPFEAERPDFTPESVERPPRPASSFDTPEPAAFDVAKPAAAEWTPMPGPEPEVAPSTNTFIAAARRAAQRTGTKPASSGAGSLIARAFASFQPGTRNADEASAPVEKAEIPAKPAKPTKVTREKKGRRLAGDKEARTEWSPEEEPAPSVAPVAKVGPAAPEPIALDQEMTSPSEKASRKGESFLSRHRRPILLAAALVAIAFLTLNLINQRIGDDGTASAPPSEADSVESDPASPLANEPVATTPAAMSTPRVVPIIDNLATASIDPAASRGFTPTTDVPVLPKAFAPNGDVDAKLWTPLSEAATDLLETATITPADPTPDAMESPVKLELPPAGVGPDPLRQAAADGDARAQFEIAAIYTEGRAVSEDLAAAAVWYERAAAQGFAPAQYRLGNLYENGRGVAKDLNQAKLWYQRAAEAGNRMAMHNLAALYAGGQLGEQEFESAAEWFEQAALRGMRDSQFNLGMLHARGLGVPQNLEESYRWFAVAAMRGDTDAAKARDDVARSLDAEAVSRLNDEVAAFVTDPIDMAANFAPIGTWSNAFDPGEPITTTDVIKSVQQALRALGYDVGTPDGVAGPKTAEAIKAFERATGMSESGAVNPRLLAVLGSQPV